MSLVILFLASNSLMSSSGLFLPENKYLWSFHFYSWCLHNRLTCSQIWAKFGFFWKGNHTERHSNTVVELDTWLETGQEPYNLFGCFGRPSFTFLKQGAWLPVWIWCCKIHFFSYTQTSLLQNQILLLIRYSWEHYNGKIIYSYQDFVSDMLPLDYLQYGSC